MKITRAQRILNDFMKLAGSYEIDPNTLERKPPAKAPLSQHWHPFEGEPTGCTSVHPGRGLQCEVTGPHTDHQSGNRKWTN
jgi:hypothetical protein